MMASMKSWYWYQLMIAKRCLAALSPIFCSKQTLWTHSKALQFPALSASSAAPPFGRRFGAMSIAASSVALSWRSCGGLNYFLRDWQWRETSCDEATFIETSLAELMGERVVSACFDHGRNLVCHASIPRVGRMMAMFSQGRYYRRTGLHVATLGCNDITGECMSIPGGFDAREISSRRSTCLAA